MSPEQEGTLPQKEAEQFIRLFNVLFNGAMLYGGTHPTALKSIKPFFDCTRKILADMETVSIVIDRESLFVEEWPVDKVINTRRILQQFGKSGIVSITFGRGLTEKDLELLIQFAGDSNNAAPVDKIEQVLQSAGCTGIQLNYVRYGRITNDQTVVGIDETGDMQGGNGILPDRQDGLNVTSSLEQLEEIVSLARLFENPEQSAAAFTRNALNPDTADGAVRALSDLRQSIHGDNAPSLDLLLNAVYELKADLCEAISVQKETGKLLAAPDPVVDEMDNLSCDVILKLVREEYGTGEVPLRRLAQIIRRMLPDMNELKRLLPRLKPALLDAGMSLSDYLELIRILNIEFESETLAGSLKEAASGIGASVDELVTAIKSQPDDAARLLVMASEIRKGTQEDEAQLSSMLTGYIEKVSTSLALESRQLTPEDGSPVLRQMLEKLENQLLDNLKKYGVEQPVLVKVGGMLAERLETTCDNATAKWITAELDANPDLSARDLSEHLVGMVGEQSRLDRLQEPVMQALASRGFDKEQMETLLKRLARKIASGKMFKLPPGVLSATNMQFLLDREIKQHHRYTTPFTTILLTVEGLRTEKETRAPTGDETRAILPKLYSVAKHILRDIDLVGGLAGHEESAVFSILAMTEIEGAEIARERILEKIGSLKLKVKDGEAALLTASSVTAPLSDKQQDVSSYVKSCLANHDAVVNDIRKANGLP